MAFEGLAHFVGNRLPMIVFLEKAGFRTDHELLLAEAALPAKSAPKERIER
jgi:hypothetical protein